MRRIANGEPSIPSPTIDDPTTLEEIRAALELLGYARAPATSSR